MERAANHSCFGVAPLERVLPVVGIILVALFVAVRPEASAGLGFAGRTLFWTLHVFTGLGAIWLASQWIGGRFALRLPPVAAIALAGLGGLLVVAPVYVAIEAMYPVPASETPDDWLDRFAAGGALHAVVAEVLEVAPGFLFTWLAVNLPLLFGKPTLTASVGAGPPDGGKAAGEADRPSVGDDAKAARDRFLDRVPEVLGRDLVALSSDLHYLHVHTIEGKTMLLGSLAAVAEAFRDEGMQVHRSHWVADSHVTRVQVSGGKAWCVMSTGLRIPVSRRRRAEAIRRYGKDSVRRLRVLAS